MKGLVEKLTPISKYKPWPTQFDELILPGLYLISLHSIISKIALTLLSLAVIRRVDQLRISYNENIRIPFDVNFVPVVTEARRKLNKPVLKTTCKVVLLAIAFFSATVILFTIQCAFDFTRFVLVKTFSISR